MIRALLTVIAISTAIAIAGNYAHAENADFWPKVRVGQTVCFAAHTHFGESTPWVSQSGARRAATPT